MKPFLLLATRDDDVAADDEYEAVRRFGGLEPGELHRVRLEARELGPLDLGQYSGLIVGGSPFNSSDPPDKKSAVQRRVESELSTLLDDVVAQDFPFLGACYGVGTLGTHQGAVIDGTYGEPVSAVRITLTDEGLREPLLAGIPREFAAFVGHKEAVRKVPQHITVLASSATCPVQMFRVKRNLYATQFHPELDLAGILTRIQIYRNHGYFPPETADQVSDQARAANVVAPSEILANFVRRFARP